MIPGSKRLVLIACSREKRSTPSAGSPANQVYTGPLWQTLVAARKEAARFRLDTPAAIVLSAKHGFINENRLIEAYDQRLTAELASFYASHPDQLSRLRQLVGDAQVIHLAGGKLYVDCMQIALCRSGFDGRIVSADAARGIGDIRQALGRFITDSPQRAAA